MNLECKRVCDLVQEWFPICLGEILFQISWPTFLIHPSERLGYAWLFCCKIVVRGSYSGFNLILVHTDQLVSCFLFSGSEYIFSTNRATSATTHVVLGQFKTCVILLGGFLLFNSNPGMSSICGAITALAGMSVYTYLNLLSSSQLGTKTSSRQLSFSLPKSKLSKENGEIQNGCCGGESV